MTKSFSFLITFFICSFTLFAQQSHYQGSIENCEYCSVWDNPPLYVYLSLKHQSNNITGTYYYTHVGTDIQLKGKQKGDSLLLQEMHNGKVTGYFQVKKIKNQLTGFWISANKKTKYPFSASFDKYPTDFKILEKTTSKEVKCGECRSASLKLVGNFSSQVKNTFNKSYPFRSCGIEEETECYCTTMSENTIRNVVFDNSFFISISTMNSDYMCGASAINHLEYALFDLTKGGEIGLSTIFTDQGIEQIRQWLNQEIKIYFEDDEYNIEEFPVQKDELSRLEDFYFTDEGIAFFLAAPGAMTNILQLEDISFSYQQIKPYLKPNTGVAKFIQKHH